MSKIEWTQQTWNPIVGCSIVSPGCTNCYAMSMAARLEAMNDAHSHAGDHRLMIPHYTGLTNRVKGKPVWTGKLALAGERILTEPLRRRKPTTYFVNSMGDLFHDDCPDEWIDRVFAVMIRCHWHTFQVLTKRSDRMRRYMQAFNSDGQGWITRDGVDAYSADVSATMWPPKNVWLGVSAERQPEADARIRDLRATPAAVRFVSGEPLLSPIDFGEHLGCGSNAEHGHPKLDWVIVGGESGPHARPMHPDWARSIRDQCAAAGVPFFFKQWGEWTPGENVERRSGCVRVAYNDDPFDDMPWHFGSEDLAVEGGHVDDEPTLYRVGKREAGRLLDGVIHDAYPSRQQHTEAA